MVKDLQRRTGKVPVDVFDIYPSEHAPQSIFVKKHFGRERVPGSEAENREIRCAQCGAHIEDHAALSECWHCGSDNFLGHELDY